MITYDSRRNYIFEEENMVSKMHISPEEDVEVKFLFIAQLFIQPQVYIQ